MKKLLIACLTAVLSLSVLASDFPTKTVKIVTSLPAGSGPDAVIRRLSDQLSAKWNVPVIIDNRPGGNGVVAVSAYNRESTDAHTLFFTSNDVFVSNPVLYKQPDLMKDLEPISGLLLSNLMVITAANVNNLAELKTLSTKNPSFGSWGIASAAHINGLELGTYFGVPSIHVAYKDYGMWFVDVMNGLLPYSFATIGSTRKLVDAGKLKYLASASDVRDPRYPTVPTFKELTGQDIGTAHPYTAFFVKSTVAPAIKERLTKDIADALNTPTMQTALDSIGYSPWSLTGPNLKKFIETDAKQYKKSIDFYKIAIE